MNADHMIDHVLGQLEGPDLERMEQAIQSDPRIASTIDGLTRAIPLLLVDGLEPDPPPALARRTLALVAQSHSRSRSILDYIPYTVPFRWADLAVAASIFIAGILTLVPAIQRSRERKSEAGCIFNLQQLGHSLAQYASLNPSYPYPPTHQADADAGTFAAFLHDAGMLQDLSVLDCPYNGPCSHPTADLPSFAELEQIRRTDPQRYRHLLCWDYSYNVGYRHPSGDPGPVETRQAVAVPVVADAPSHQNYVHILDGNSPNHGRRGQNVLWSNGSVKFHPTRRVSPIDADLYLNNQQQLQPGVDEHDSVLVPSYSPFNGQKTR